MKIKIYYWVSLCLLAAGMLLMNTLFQLKILNTASLFFNKQFNFEFWKHGFFYCGLYLVIFCFLFLCYDIIFKNKNNIYFVIISVCLIALPYYWTVFIYSVNIPVSDDYELIIDFINNYRQASGIGEKMGLIFSQYFECKFIFLHVIIVIQNYIFGSVNLKFFMFVSSLTIPLIAYLLYKSSLTKNIILLIIIFILLFQYQYHGGIFWVIGGFPKFFVILFSILSFYFLQKKTLVNLSLSFLFSMLAVFSFGNGVLCIVLNAGLLLLKKRWRDTIIYISLGLLLCFLYFSGYYPISPLKISFDSIAGLQLYSFLFLGNCIQFLYKMYLPYTLGIIIWLMFFYLTFLKYYIKNPVIYFTLLFVILSSILAGLFRIEGATASQPLQTTYGIYSIIAVCSCIIAVTDYLVETKFQRFTPYLLVLSCAYHLLSDIMFYPENSIRKEYLSNCILPWLKDRTTDAPPMCRWYSDPIENKSKEYKQIIRKSKELDSFSPSP